MEAYFANGCFWCTESVFKMLKGVLNVTSGYANGNIVSPTYDLVSIGDTGFAECIKIEFDESVISYSKMLDVFFASHDPTTLNMQGADVGTQYRSGIFYVNDFQKKEATLKIKELSDKKIYRTPIVTEVTPLKNFFEAENYHQDFYNKNKYYPYCSVVISPKVKKIKEDFSDFIK